MILGADRNNETTQEDQTAVIQVFKVEAPNNSHSNYQRANWDLHVNIYCTLYCSRRFCKSPASVQQGYDVILYHH